MLYFGFRSTVLKLLEKIMSAQTDLAVRIDGLTTRLTTLDGLIQSLVAAAKAAGSVEPALQTAVDNLEAALGKDEADAAPTAPAPAP